MMMVENLACEESRKMKKFDLKYYFKYRFNNEDIDKHINNNWKRINDHVWGMQNFYLMKWDNEVNGMRLHLLRSVCSASVSSGGPSKFILEPVQTYIHINGEEQRIDFVDKSRDIPFNAVNYVSREVVFCTSNLPLKTRKRKLRRITSNQGPADALDSTSIRPLTTKKKRKLKLSLKKKV